MNYNSSDTSKNPFPDFCFTKADDYMLIDFDLKANYYFVVEEETVTDEGGNETENRAPFFSLANSDGENEDENEVGHLPEGGEADEKGSLQKGKEYHKKSANNALYNILGIKLDPHANNSDPVSELRKDGLS